MKRYTGKIIVDTGYVNCTHEADYDFTCEPEEFQGILDEMSEQAVWDSITTYTQDEAEEDVEDDE